MDQQKFSLSYDGYDKLNVDSYIYNFSADYYDLYGDEFDDQGLYYQPNVDEEPSIWGHLSFAQLCMQCIIPAIWSTCNLLGTTLVLCIFFRLFIVTSNKISIVPEAILHLVCAVCGILPLIIFHEDGDLYQLFLQIVLFPMVCYIVSTICIFILKSHSAIVFSTLILFSLFYRECFLDNLKWRKTKSAHMLMSMKAMAVLFDLQSKELHAFPSVAQYAGYMMCAGSVYLGPFLTFQEYINAFLLPVDWNKTKVWNVIQKIIVSLVCFVLSICVVEWTLNQHLYTHKNSNSITYIFLSMYKQALEFRTSHYFVAYASTVFAIVCGYHFKYNSEILVTRLSTIEWPQSLLHVVVYWNTPMHYWLKKYVFKEMLKYSNRNKKIAVGITYLISSLLHGLEQRLSAVLLSLAGYTYVEHQIRTKLATKFPRYFSYYSKNDYCHYGSKRYLSSSSKSTWFQWSINIMFTILNIIHLAYLGSIMDLTVEHSDIITEKDFFAPWRRVSYFSHFIMVFMYIISIFL